MQITTRSTKKSLWSLLALLLLAAAIALATAATTSAKTAHVKIKSTPSNYRFSPKKVSLAVGGKVNWSWHSDADHNVTFTKVPKGASKRSSETDDRLSFSRSFTKAGTYRYECTIHDFTGSVVAGG
jgi:plastocyanin